MGAYLIQTKLRTGVFYGLVMGHRGGMLNVLIVLAITVAGFFAWEKAASYMHRKRWRATITRDDRDRNEAYGALAYFTVIFLLMYIWFWLSRR